MCHYVAAFTDPVIYCCIIYKYIFLTLIFFTFNNNIIGELVSTTSKERMTTNIIFMGATPIN